MARILRTVLLVGIVATLVILAALAARRASSRASGASGLAGPDLPTRTARFKRIDDGLGRPHMSALGNATIRAELGRSTWTLLHTMAARFPDEPTAEQQDDLRDFVYLLSRLYPCGQCAEEFQKILRDHPPEVESKDAAIHWLCRVHNIVNARLEKPIFDCAQVRDRWKCGCVSEV